MWDGKARLPMTAAPISLISGPPGAGKSTIAASLALHSDSPKAVHLHTDSFYRCIKKGYIPPWQAGSEEQNTVAMEAIVATARRYASGGYHVAVDGVIGPWFLEPWLNLVDEGFEVRLVVLRPDLETTQARATARDPAHDLTDLRAVTGMWNHFSHLGRHESYVLDTSAQTIAQTFAAVGSRLKNPSSLLGPSEG